MTFASKTVSTKLPSQAMPLSSVPPVLRVASSHLGLLAEVLETYTPGEFPQMNILYRLKTDLVVAMNIYRIAYQENAPLDVQLMREADLQWYCNQCDYYLSQRKGSPLLAPSQGRGLWHIRQVIRAMIRLKLLTHVRKFMPGPNTLSISWREILPGIRL
ncbi:MAG: hypothetical protein AB8B99_20330 [Phormidesmis sp.]